MSLAIADSRTTVWPAACPRCGGPEGVRVENEPARLRGGADVLVSYVRCCPACRTPSPREEMN